ncbi:Quinolinate phosphoribosyl transferase [Thermofilum pendens Hrk 5]|uniref:Quinolinate phosphoribosyl transferase n=1 Tax=Thermofilum pendens (strain DSM 2475 / Hrk 5) TaxID=368408 RepID=A1RZT1_THEPD|nr:Quinolinate phosphoribosyl transferase [Thermofilum pendens Hrk 5]
MSLLGAGVEGAVERLVARVGYRAVGVEVVTLEEALEALEAGARYARFDGVGPATLNGWVRVVKAGFPEARVGASGGVTAENVADYARAGVDVVVTSAPFRALPLDFTTAMGR